MSTFRELGEILSAQTEPPSDPSTFLASLGSPSVSIAILDHGEITAHCYSTVGDDTTTRFQACSISKAVTAMGVMRLFDDGLIELDDKIIRYLPKTIVENLGPPALVNQVTIEHCLSHTAGLTASGFPGYASENHPSPDEVVLGKYPVNTERIQVVAVPGRQYSYSGGGYTLLQIVMEKITGKSFVEAMRDIVIEPLGMKSSKYGTPETGHRLATAHWTGFTPSPHWHYFPEMAAAGLWTTPTDLCKVLHAVQKSLQGLQGAFLKQDTTKRMLTEIGSNFMALGWATTKDPGNYFGHIGSNDPGYRCVAMGIADVAGQRTEFPNAECGVAVMTNSATGVLPAFTVLQTINYIKGWREGATVSKSMAIVTPMKVPSQVVRGEWRNWLGRWVGNNDEWIIEADGDGQPQARWHGRPPVRMLPAAICSSVLPEGESVDLVFDGLAAMMRLAWRDGKPSVNYIDGLTFAIAELSRAD
jgi:CubicO group peptidase (beta-lactamase class C family)